MILPTDLPRLAEKHERPAVRPEEHGQVTFGIRLERSVWALILSMVGWASVKTGWALRATLLVTGYAAMLALFARADTFYWALIPAPLAFLGLAFLPKAAADLAKAVRHTPYPAK